MALLAEELVEEWLRRQGFFTIRGIKLGVDEIDLLEVRQLPDGMVECRHIEVQASMRPVSFISQVPKDLQRRGRAANSATRTKGELVMGVKEWVEKKFSKPKKTALMAKLWDGPWTAELVLNVVRDPGEPKLIAAHGIKIRWLRDIARALESPDCIVQSASGADFVDLIQMGSHLPTLRDIGVTKS